MKCRDLEIRVRGHSRSLKVVPFDRLLPKMHCFFSSDIQLQKSVTLKTELGVCQGYWKCYHAIERIQLPIDVL